MRLLLVLLFCGALMTAHSQSVTDAKEIMEPVTKLFTGMNLGDSAMVHSVFMSGASLHTVAKDKEGKPTFRKDDIQKFYNAVGTPHDQTWSEPIWDAKIQMDGNLASVWVKYAFYLGNKFSHCGVDSFQLAKGVDGKWKIFFLADTRQREGCQIPKEISEQFK